MRPTSAFSRVVRCSFLILEVKPGVRISSSRVKVDYLLQRVKAGWQTPEIQEFFEGHGFLVREWARARTDWLTLRPAKGERADAAAI